MLFSHKNSVITIIVENPLAPDSVRCYQRRMTQAKEHDNDNKNCPDCGMSIDIEQVGLDYELHICSQRCGWGGAVRVEVDEVTQGVIDYIEEHGTE